MLRVNQKRVYFIFGSILTLLSHTAVAAESVLNKKVTPAESLLPMLGGLAGIIVLILLLAAFLKKFSNLNLVASHIKIIDSQNLGAKEKLVIVEIQDKQYVLGVTPHNINRVCELDDPIAKKESSLSFDSMMKQLLRPQKSTMKSPVSESKIDTHKNKPHGVD